MPEHAAKTSVITSYNRLFPEKATRIVLKLLSLRRPSAFVCTALSAATLALTIGCGSGGSSGGGTQQQPGIPALSLSATSLTFASTTVGQSSAAQTVTLTNAGSAALTLTSATLSDANNYSLTNNCGTSLAASATCTLGVTFTPKSAGTLTATITLADNSGGSATTQVIALTGTGVAAPPGTASLSTTSLSFSLAAGTTSSTQTVTLSNTGTGTLTLSAISLDMNSSATFTLASGCGSTLAAGAGCVLNITFTPTSAGTTYTGGVTIVDNSGGVAGATQGVTLTGTQATSAASAVTFSPATLDFGSVIVNSTSTAKTVTLTNSGTAALALTSITITGGSTASAFTQTNNCPASLSTGSSCTISITFKPFASGTYAASLTATDNAADSPQTASLSGTGVTSGATLSSSSITFPTTTVNTTASSGVTLTNSGTAALTITSIVLSGTNASNFATTNNCGTSLAAGASCTITATFTPTAASSYSATITVTDSAPSSPQVIAVTGSGTTSAVTRTLYTFPESDNSVTPLYALVNSATKTIDMTMYEMQDTTMTANLVARCKAGVIVRVIFSQSVASSSSTAYSALNAQTNCSAVYSNSAFTNTHQKTITVDNTTTAIMSLNLQSQYYSTTRDFALVTNDAADIAAIEATFAQDYAAGGTKNTTEFGYQPSTGDDLIWSPTTAEASMLSIINNAQKTLVIENEELASSASYIINAMTAACQRGVVLHLAMVNQSSYQANFKTLENAGCGVHVYPDTTNGFYIHAKAVVADYGLSTQNAYMGSINYSDASMNKNRELGLFLSDQTVVTSLYNTLTADYAGGTAY